MHSTILVAALLQGSVAGVATETPACPFDRAIPIHLAADAPSLTGHGPRERVEYRAEFTGSLYAWTTSSPETDLFLRVDGGDGTALGEDDDSGGGHTPFLLIDVERGRDLVVTVAASKAGSSGDGVLHLVAAPETEATLAAESAAVAARKEADASSTRGDLARAREVLSQSIRDLLATPGGVHSARIERVVWNAATAAYEAGDLDAAHAAWRFACEFRSRTLPADHHDLQFARENLASATFRLGDLRGARVLQQQALDAFARTLPADHSDLVWAKLNLAGTVRKLGDLAGARALLQEVSDSLARTQPGDSPALQAVELSLASIMKDLGDLAGARELEEKVLGVFERTLPPDHPDLQTARLNLAGTIKTQGDFAGARELEESVVEVQSRSLPDDHPQLLFARANLAATMCMLGDVLGARTVLEAVVAVLSRTLPPDHPDLLEATLNLAATLHDLGDFAGARALEERVLEIRSRTLPDDHPALVNSRRLLSATLHELGEFSAARELQETALEVASRTLPDDHPELQTLRLGLAVTLERLGDRSGARSLEEKVLEIRARTLPDDHPSLQKARESLAVTLFALGDFSGARALFEQVLEVRSRVLPADDPDLQWARANVAATLANELASPSGPPRAERERANVRARCGELIHALCRAEVRNARRSILSSPGREAEERCALSSQHLDTCLSFAGGYGVFEPLRALESESFELAETMRGAAVISAELARSAAREPRYANVRRRLRDASGELARLAQAGTNSDEFQRARVERETAERELLALASERTGKADRGAEFDVATLAASLGEHVAAISFRRFQKRGVEIAAELDSTGRRVARETAVDSLCAFVVRAESGAKRDASCPVAFVDLGSLAQIDEAARGWREAIGAGRERGMAVERARIDEANERGARLRELVMDPWIASLGDVRRIVIVLDDVLQLVPLDALPLADSAELAGDRWCIETRATLTELSRVLPEATGTALVAIGGASYNLPPLALSAEEVASIEAEPPTQVAGLLRSTAWARGFEPLTHAAEEARGIGALYEEIFDDARAAIVLEKRKASRAALEELAPKARFVHIATHGWFAPESIRSWNDPEPLDRHTGLGSRASGAEQVRGMAPMLLCGLALAGANLPEDAAARAPGLVTADELSTLDLSNCELAVLSACDTNVGERRAGQGLASLQKALQMAGARSVITSLWKVPDEATKELMLDFYRRLWVEKKPKHQALWEAKTKLREAKDERGAPKYTTRDWAAWVLTGDPR